MIVSGIEFLSSRTSDNCPPEMSVYTERVYIRTRFVGSLEAEDSKTRWRIIRRKDETIEMRKKREREKNEKRSGTGYID